MPVDVFGTQEAARLARLAFTALSAHVFGQANPNIVACTLLPYDAPWDLGPSLAGATGAVPLNHPHCAKFCVLGGGACSRG